MQSENPLKLAPRQLEILDLVAQGFQNKEIASKLSISEHTVKNALSRIFEKLGVSDRLEAVLCYISRHPEKVAELAPAGNGNY